MIFLGILAGIIGILTTLVVLNPVRKKMNQVGGNFQLSGDGVLNVDGKEVRVKYVRGSRRRAPQVLLSVPGSFPAELVIRGETKLDRFFNKIGLDREFQTTDADLNHAFYFECDDPGFLSQTFQQPDVKIIVMSMLKDFTAIVITQNSCALKMIGGKRFQEMSKEDIVNVSRQLLRFVNLVPKSLAIPSSLPSTYKRWRSIFLGLSFIVLSFGVLALIWGAAAFSVVEARQLWLVSVPVTFLFTSIISFLVYIKIRGFARSSSVLIPFLIFFLVGALLLGRYGTAVYNGISDTSDPHRFEVMAVNRFFRTHKNSRSYYITVTPWREGMSAWDLRVSAEEYNNVLLGQTRYVITSREGSLGFEWIEKHQRL